MTTFTVQIKDKDTETVLTILKKFKVKVIETSTENKLTLEIAEAIKEVKQMHKGKIEPLSLNNIC